MGCIVIADNSDKLRLALRLVLEHAGHQVIEVSDGAEAARLCASNNPDLLIYDIGLPNKDGLETIGDLRRSGRCGRILALREGGARQAFESSLLAKLLGADEILVKPFHLRDALSVVGKLLAQVARSNKAAHTK